MLEVSDEVGLPLDDGEAVFVALEVLADELVEGLREVLGVWDEVWLPVNEGEGVFVGLLEGRQTPVELLHSPPGKEGLSGRPAHSNV